MGSDVEGQRRSRRAASRTDGGNSLWTILMMFLLVFLGSLNFILVKAMYNAFGSSYAFFANQGVNFLYVLYGGAILQQKMLSAKELFSPLPGVLRIAKLETLAFLCSEVLLLRV